MYVRVVDGVFEDYNIRNLYKENPKISFPKELRDELLAQYNVYPYTLAPHPAYDVDTQTLQGGTWELVDGSYVRSWTTINLSAEEVAAKVKAKADDEKLAKADPILVVDAIDQLVKDVDALTKRVEALEAKDKP